MANLSALAEVPQSLDQRQIWFTNLLLLGFDPIAQEDKTKVHFCKEMFVHINKKGMEVTLHYLFNRLDSHIAYEEFRDCWPVYDKKQEAQFRKVCSNWLTRISKDDPESKIPRLSASILMSPGGERFEQLMLRFTTHVLRAVCLREAKAEEKQVYLSSFVTSPSSLRPSPSTNPHLLRRALQCHIIRHSHSVAQRLQLNAALHDHWRQFVSDQVKEYRSLGRKKRELEAQLKDASAAPPSTRTEGRGSTWSTPSEDKARRNKMKMVRGYWKSLDDFLSKSSHEREVVSAVAKGNANKYAIDAKDLQFQIPDVVLHLYEAKLREGTAGNTYEGGKLNLVSLLQLWNCALEVMRDKFRECELPSFHEESEEMKELLQAHRVNLATSQSLRASLMEYQQSLQGSIERLERELVALRQSRSECGEGGEGGEGDRGSGLQTPQQFHIPPITLPSLGLDLLPPSPHKSQSLSSPDNMGHLQSHLSHLSLPSDSVSTPEAVHNISLSIQRHSRSQRLAPSHSSPSPHPTSHPHHHHPTADTGNERDTSRPSRKTLIPVKSRKNRERQTRPRPPITPLTRGRITSSAHVSEGMEATPTTSRTREPCSPQIKPTNPRLMDTMPAAHNILASQIAAAVAGDSPLSPTSPHTPEHQMHSLADPLSALGKEAFVSQYKIPRTPVKDTTTISASSPCSHEDTSPPVSSVTPSSLLTPVPNITTPSPLSRTLTSSTDTTSLLTPVPNITTPSPLSRTLTSSTDTTLLLTPVPNITTPSPLSHTLTSSTDTTLLLTPVPNITTPSTLSQSTTGTTSLLTPVTNTQASFLSSPKPSPHTSLISLQQPSPSHTSPKSHSHTLTSPWLSKYSASPHVFMSPNSPLHNITTATPRHNVTATPHHNVTATPSHNVTATPSHNVTTTPSQIVTTPHHNVTPHHPSKAMSPLINFSPFVVPPSSTHLPSSRATTPMAVPSFDLMGFGSPLTSGGSTDPAQAGKSPGSLQAVLTDSSGGPVRQSSPSLFPTTDVTIGTPARIASTEASVTTATVMPVPPTGVPQTTTHNQQESKTSLSVPQTTGDPSGATHSPSQSSVAVSPASTSDRVSALKSHLHSVTTTPLAFSMTSKDPSFLLSSQSPTPPFLHDSTLDEDEEQEGGGGEEEGERDVEGKGENKTGLSSILSTSLNGDAVAGTREERSLVEDGKNKSAVEHHSELKPNGIHLGVQIHSSLHDSDLNCYSPSDTSTRQTSSPLRSGVQLIDFSSPSSPHHLPPTLLPPTSSPSSPHHHPPTLPPPSSSPPHPPPHLSPRPPHLPPRPLSHPPSPFPQVPTHVPSPPPHPPPANNDDGKEWRQLDISGSHSSLPSTPANQSLKWVVEKHQLSSSSENGLFGGTDSFLVPLSPHSDFSGEDDEQ